MYPTAGMVAGSPALAAFFARTWMPTTTPAEMAGFVYVFDEQGNLVGEYGSGGARSSGSRQYVWLPTANGAMPIATIKDGTVLAVTADHLNTPRRLAASNGALVWQWSYSSFGDEAPTVATRKFAKVAAVDGDIEFNPRYPGQYFDKESNLHYNGLRTYNPQTGRYTQGDPIGLDGGWNRFGYVGANPLIYTDPKGLNAQVVGPAMTMLPMLAIGYATSSGIRDAVNGMAQRCGNAVSRLANLVFSENEDKPSLLDPKGETHVLDGDKTGGGHRPGTGKPGKSEFPSGWSDDRIKGEISDVATDPGSSSSPGRGGREVVRGTRGGVDIEVIVEPGGRIVTGYPTNVPRNPR